MTITQLDEKSLDRYLGLSGWKDRVSTDPLPGPSPSDATWSRKVEIDRIRASIRTILARSSGLSAQAPFTLRKPTCIAAVLERASAEQYAVLCEICDILRGDHDIKIIAGFEDEAAWNGAIAATRRVRHFSEYDSYTLDHASRPRAVGEACSRLEKHGFVITLTAHGVGVDATTFSAICADLEWRIQQLGGRRVIDAILKWFETNRRVYEGSLLYGRTVSQVPKAREPSIPWHFLYNIAWKHFGAAPTSKNPARDIMELAELARDMAAVFDVEAYDTFDGMFLGAANFHQGLSDRVVYDELFAFQQWQPKVAGRVFSSWLRHLAAGCAFPRAAREEWDALGSSLIAKSQLTALTITHPAEHAGATLTSDRAAELFDALAIPLDELNKGYAIPVDTSKRNSPYFPLYKISLDLYALPPRGMAARALFERVYTLLREAKVPNLENRMGTALEHITAEAVQLTGHPPAYVGLQYRPASQRKGDAPLEVDIADESDERIFFIECKKKPLTNAARSGNVLSAAVDLASAFLVPLVQINRHEAQLRAGGITFLSGQTLKLNGRDIQRVDVTMTDHGSMQDRMFLRAFLIGMWGATLTALDPKHQADADKVNEQLRSVAEGITALAGEAGGKFDDFVHQYIGSSWWLSIDQFTFLCERTRDLRKATSPVGGVIFGTGDLMNEIAHYDRMGFLKPNA